MIVRFAIDYSGDQRIDPSAIKYTVKVEEPIGLDERPVKVERPDPEEDLP